MEDFKQYMNEDPEEDERAAERVRMGLAGLRIEHEVAEAGEAHRKLLRQRFWTRVVTLVTLVVMASAAFLFFRKQEKLIQADPQPPIESAPSPPIQQHSPQQAPDQKQPVADRSRTPQEKAEQPLVRSVQPDLDTATQRLVKVLLRITVNNDAVFRPEHDDKRYGWGKIVRLLNENKPVKAKEEIFKSYPDDKEGDWLLSIALLEEGKIDEALAIFNKMANNPEHHRQKEAKLAVEALLK